jgi:hypothetical protein
MLFAMVALAGSLLAQDDPIRPSDFFTKDIPNGLAWRVMSADKKNMFVTGYRLGLSDGRDLLTCTGTTKRLANLETGKITAEMDAFYSAVGNLPIQINGGLLYSWLKLSGATKEELEQVRLEFLK